MTDEFVPLSEGAFEAQGLGDIEIGFGFYIDEPRLVPAIGEYVTYIETGETKDTCKCQWLEDHSTGLKMQRVEESLECPVHTKEGFILGFFRWMFPDADITRPVIAEEAALIKYGKGENGKPDPDLSALLSARIHDQEASGIITHADHDYSMPHDTRAGWDSVMGCPPNCPARAKYARMTNAGN